VALIPTILKTKLPDGLAYPVGAEAISAALEQVPQYDALKLGFHKPHSDNALVIHSTGVPPMWTITIHAVPSSSRSLVRDQLLREGLARVARWLAAPRAATWYLQRQQFVVGYDPGGSLNYAEFAG
jgi:hypothetical protein